MATEKTGPSKDSVTKKIEELARYSDAVTAEHAATHFFCEVLMQCGYGEAWKARRLVDEQCRYHEFGKFVMDTISEVMGKDAAK